MKLDGLKAIFLGDSITEGVGASSIDKVYWKQLAEMTGMSTVGYGVSGTRIARQEQEGYAPEWKLDFNLRAKDMDKDADIVGVFGGTNDYGHGFAPIGTADDDTEWTFYGALNCLFRYFIENYPEAYIFVMTPIHRTNEDRVTGDGYKPPMLPLSGYVDIIKEVARKYSLPVLDLYAESGIYPDIEVSKDAYTVDGLHPNDKGYRRIATMVKNFLETHYFGK